MAMASVAGASATLMFPPGGLLFNRELRIIGRGITVSGASAVNGYNNVSAATTLIFSGCSVGINAEGMQSYPSFGDSDGSTIQNLKIDGGLRPNNEKQFETDSANDIDYGIKFRGKKLIKSVQVVHCKKAGFWCEKAGNQFAIFDCSAVFNKKDIMK